MRVARVWKGSLLLVAAAAIATSVVTSLSAADVQTVGLFQNDKASYEGFTLFSTPRNNTSYLINNDGLAVHTWDIGSGLTPYLLDDGSVMWHNPSGLGRSDWNSSLVWSYPVVGVHHDIEPLPNGNVLAIIHDRRTLAEATAAGRDPVRYLFTPPSFVSERIVEIEPTGPSSGSVVWQWSVWDHLVQDFDPSKENFDSVTDHPELVDINFGEPWRTGTNHDWLHANSVDYNPELDQILISIRQFSEFWVIDHSTTTEEAASHSGGDSGNGGDLLYRWGNPQAYDAGDQSDQMLFYQHDAQWIRPGLPGAGNMLVFNNGEDRPDGTYSSVDELEPPVDSLGNYSLSLGGAFGPDELVWSYSNPFDFYSRLVSGADRLPNGNTLIDEGGQGTFFEVTPKGETVWRYVNPVIAAGPLRQGEPVPAGESLDANAVFRANRYPLDHPAFAGRDLTPRGPIELPKATPTNTATSTTVPVPATPTITPTPVGRTGDVDGDGRITAIDAALLLQFDAGLLANVPDPARADMNGDGSLNAIDAALILQTTAGLIAAIPT